MSYTPVAGIWNFGNCSWLGPQTNPVLFAALTKEKDGSFSNFVRLIPESVDDYNLDPQIIKAASLQAIPLAMPAGMNFYPGGIGYAVNDLGTRVALYRSYHDGNYPPWSPAPTLKPKSPGLLQRWLKIFWS